MRFPIPSRLSKSLRSFASRYRHNSHAVLGLGIFVFTLLVSIFAPQISTFDPEKIDIPKRLLPPDGTHFLGTDKLGRDIFSRMVWGTRVSMLIGFIASGLATLIGLTIGVVAGYFGGRTDWILMRFVDMILSIPTFFLVLLASSLFGSNIYSVMVFIGLTLWPSIARIIRGMFLSFKERPFVDAATASGAKDFHISVIEILPNAIYPAIVQFSFLVGTAILIEAGLSFLGLGDPNVISWGWMLNDALQTINIAWWSSTFPGLAITLVIISFNMIGDGLNDALNPKLKEG